MAKQYAVYLCGGPEPLREGEPCPKDGPAHDPWPTGYDAGQQYAAQLLATGWTQHRCPACGLWRLWRPEQPQPLPPMLPRDADDTPWEIPPEREDTGCATCEDGAPCLAVGR